MKLKRFLAVFFVVALLMTLLSFSAAAAGESTDAYIAYASSDWGAAYWGPGNADNTAGVVATNATITGSGTYTVGLDFTGIEAGAANGLTFTAVIMKDATTIFPGAVIKVDEIKVNGAAINFTKGYTNNEEGHVRTNILNPWVAAVPTDDANDSRTADGSIDDASAQTVDAMDFPAEVKTMTVTFTVTVADEEAPAAPAAPATTANPKTGDPGLMVLGLTAVVSLAGMVVSKKRK